jgi:hypothetical protein
LFALTVQAAVLGDAVDGSSALKPVSELWRKQPPAWYNLPVKAASSTLSTVTVVL